MHPYGINIEAGRPARSSRGITRTNGPMGVRPRLIIWCLLFLVASGLAYLGFAWAAAAGLANQAPTVTGMRWSLAPSMVLFALSVLPLVGRGAPWGSRIVGTAYALLVAWGILWLLCV